MEKSAGSHERVAKSYEMAAASSGHDEYLQHAARHREFAREDLRIAERLRQMAEGDDG
ncbi:hypothetical protein [Mycobacterium sp. 94-17]|uniref:hypothetical protein n=1 Tax=Mycobacterium sp. 94-17 TaxID=2986147 RepID=UPI002D1F260A|nr:hypothetical protein [Mycobacterium sp. 94-17]MEB4208348.1 hypothetical protein [Mycobacterium sp. 94-17]